jgi:Uma2 family endonuclease
MLVETQYAKALPTTLKTVDEFEAWERQHPHEGSYEFVRGRIIQKSAMKQYEVLLANFLIRLFMRTHSFSTGNTLMPESDSYVDGVRRRVPDLTYFTAEQLDAIRRDERVNTFFAIEILSDSESHDDVLDKIDDYFDGGAQLVWYIIPKRQRIEAYTSPFDRRVYTANDQISAAPVVPELTFKVADLFV